MPTMRHPRVDGQIDAPESAVTAYRMSGWVTEEENPDLFVADEPDEDEAADGRSGSEKPASEPESSGEDKPKASRRPRASSKESE